MKQLISTFLLSILFFSQSYSQWILKDSGTYQDLWAISFADDDVGYAGGGPWQFTSSCVVTKTNDGGETWIAQNPVSFVSCIFGITALNADTVYAVGCNATYYYGLVLRSFDGGETWTIKNMSNTWGFYCVEFPTNSIGYTCGWNGRIYKTTNAGESWVSLPSGSSQTFRRMCFVDENLGYAACGADHASTNKIYKTTDGNSWSQISSFGSSFIIGGMHFFDENIGVVVGTDGSKASIKRTIDGGENWGDVLIGNHSFVLESLYFDGDIGWAAGKYGSNNGVFYSDDGGESWELHFTGLSGTPYSAYRYNNNNYVAGTSGMIMVFEDDPSSIFSPYISQLIEVYPNPAKDNVLIDLSKFGSADSIEIFDINGRRSFYQKIESTKQINLDVKLWGKGIFLIKIYADDNHQSIKLIIQ